MITVFDINLFKARRGWGMKGNMCNFVSFSALFNKMFLHLIFLSVCAFLVKPPRLRHNSLGKEKKERSGFLEGSKGD